MRRLLRRILRRPRRTNPERRMTVVEHLDELRYRLVWMIGATGVASVAGWLFFDRIVGALLRPARAHLPGGALVFTGPLDAFTLRLKVAFYAGIALAFPLLLFHTWRFIAPGLHRRERRYAMPFVFFGTVLFAAGALFAYVTLPEALKFLIGAPISGRYIRPLLTGQSYLSFILLYLFAFGLSFEFPVVLMFLLLARVLTTRQLARNRRYVLVGISIVVAVGTPSVDMFTMLSLTVALYVLYEACIWIARLLKR